MPRGKQKILFFAEGATLAHVGRPYVLAESLDSSEFEVAFARPTSFAWLTANANFPILDLHCQDSAVFARRLDWGQPLYDYRTLERYLADDLALIEAEQPDVIVGDFRLSLSISARLAKVPYITLCDAYWSPERPLIPPLPVMAWTPYVPLGLATWAFKHIAPSAMRTHTAPLEKLRAQHGLDSLGQDIRRCYTDADLRLFANPPLLFADTQTHSRAQFIGPIAWSPRENIDLDSRIGTDPLIYVTMGSSGDPAILMNLLPALEQTGLPIVIATAGKPLPPLSLGSQVQIFDYLPGAAVCKRAVLVVCNGGSPTTNQALSTGTPVLGIAKNMDQFLNMGAIESFGAGLLVRADRADRNTLEDALRRLLEAPSFKERATQLSPSQHPLIPLGTHLRTISTL